MIDPEDTGDLARDVARRLRRTRLALRIAEQQEFGKRAGLTQSAYHHFESGDRCLTLRAALRMCETYGLTLDWLYRGDPSGLPYRLASELARELAERQAGNNA